MRIILALSLTVLLLTSCARPPVAPSDPAPAPAPAPEQSPVAPAPVTPDAQPPVQIELELPVPAALPEGTRQVELPADQPLNQAGLYFVDLAGGKLEGWLPPNAEQVWPGHNLWPSPDERYIVMLGAENGYLIRRQDGAALRYDPRRVVVTPGPANHLVRPGSMTPGTPTACALINDQGKLVASFTLKSGCANAIFSPDGQYLAVSTPEDAYPVSLVTVATGAIWPLKPTAAPTGIKVNGTRLSQHDGELLVELNWAGTQSRLQRYTWQGQLKDEREMTGRSFQLSPDGKYLIHSQDLGVIGQASVLSDWKSGEPQLRVAGGRWSQWVANSREVLISTSRGYKLLSLDGILKDASQLTGEKQFNPFLWLQPSPIDSDLFLLSSGKVVSRSGQARWEALLPKESPFRIGGVNWGPGSGKLHFVVYSPGGKGWEGEVWAFLEPRVQRAPFPEPYQLQVADPKGECLNLRADATVGGKVIRCLPNGTRLAEAKSDPGMGVRWTSDHWWLEVRTEQGEVGWVAVSTGSLGYAEK